jgi:ribonucleotide monophosphatase NagD (HAD superfamily)
MGYPPEVVVGKPSKIAFDIALEVAGCEKEEALMVGDRLETDILGAVDAGIDSALVLTGVTTEDMLTGDVRACFVADSILELAEGGS